MILAILGFAATALITVPPLVKKKYWRELIIFCILYVFGFIVTALYAADVPLQSPLRMFKKLLDSIHFHY